MGASASLRLRVRRSLALGVYGQLYSGAWNLMSAKTVGGSSGNTLTPGLRSVVVTRLRQQGVIVLFISHRWDEIVLFWMQALLRRKRIK